MKTPDLPVRRPIGRPKKATWRDKVKSAQSRLAAHKRRAYHTEKELSALLSECRHVEEDGKTAIRIDNDTVPRCQICGIIDPLWRNR